MYSILIYVNPDVLLINDYCELPVSFSWGNMCIILVVKGILSVCNQ